MISNSKELANHIAGRGVLHLNSLGKDSAVCLEWLCNYAFPSRIVSVFYKRLASHPDDDRYLNYLKKRYPQVEFIVEQNGHELDDFGQGVYQSPIDVISEFNKWEHYDFSMSKQAEELRVKPGLDFKCIGNAKYESVARAIKFNKFGLLHDKTIYPIGMFQKQDVLKILMISGLKVHPTYKIAQSTFDFPSYYKMRSAFILDPEFKRKMFTLYPLLALDKYRYEKTLKTKSAQKA